MPLIIDGHNLLWSVQNTGGDFELVSDVWLCRILARYLKQISETGQIVFDGTGPRDKSQFDNISNLEVFFAGLASDADTVIEAKIRANTAPKRLTIVSSDHRLRKAARVRKAISVKSELFWSSVQQQLSRKKTPKEPSAKQQGLTESETRQWLDFFGLEQ